MQGRRGGVGGVQPLFKKKIFFFITSLLNINLFSNDNIIVSTSETLKQELSSKHKQKTCLCFYSQRKHFF